MSASHRRNPVRSVEAFPVAATLLGLPLLFKVGLPMDNPQRAELSEMTRVASMRGQMVPRILPARIRADGSVCQPWVAEVPLAPVPASFWGGPVERVLFSVSASVKAGAVEAEV